MNHDAVGKSFHTSFTLSVSNTFYLLNTNGMSMYHCTRKTHACTCVDAATSNSQSNSPQKYEENLKFLMKSILQESFRNHRNGVENKVKEFCRHKNRWCRTKTYKHKIAIKPCDIKSTKQVVHWNNEHHRTLASIAWSKAKCAVSKQTKDKPVIKNVKQEYRNTKIQPTETRH